MLKLVAMAYDKMMRGAEERCLVEWRSELLSGLSGDVLEVGAGTGASLALYPTAVDALTLMEPAKHMRSQLQQRVDVLRPDAVIVDGAAEAMPFPEASFDAVVSSLVLCSVRQPSQVLSEIRRVLRPNGRFMFIEHVAATDRPDRLKWQRRVEPIWKRLVGNCHLTRDTESAIGAAGFTLTQVERASMRGAPSFVRPCIRGCAVPNG